MQSITHKNLKKQLASISQIPDNPNEYKEWLKGAAHLQLIQEYAYKNELMVFASTEPSVLVHAVVVPKQNLTPYIDYEDLLQWSSNPYSHKASYSWGINDVGIERGLHCVGSKSLKNGHLLVYGRKFDGFDDHYYFELHQEYAHVTDIHLCPQHGGYCRIDRNGDIENVVSESSERTDDQTTLFTFLREPLENYLEVTDSILIQLFDFTMYSPGKFSGWSIGEQNTAKINDKLIYKYKIDAYAAFYRGVQIIDPTRSRKNIFLSIGESITALNSNQHVSYIALDFRNNKIVKISTNRNETTNYFQTENNSLPFELSPAFFRPEVLSKFKSNRDKYVVSEREITCRATWSLRYGVNDAYQVFVYIRDLRYLPLSEKKYWASFNEYPEAGLPNHIVKRDFLSEPADYITPVEQIRSIFQAWNSKNYKWWKLRDKSLLTQVNAPYTSNRDEWVRAFIDLSKLIIEGFVTAELRVRLEQLGVKFDGSDKSILLLEKLCSLTSNLQENQRLMGLRSIQKIRSKGGIVHASGSEAASLSNDALQIYGGYADHFNSICRTTATELLEIERLLNIDT